MFQSQIAAETRFEVMYYILSAVGVETLEEIVEQAKHNRKTKSHTDYTNLTEILIAKSEHQR